MSVRSLWIKDLVKESLNNKSLYFDVIYLIIAVVLGILGSWTLPAAITIYFVQFFIFILISFYFFIKSKPETPAVLFFLLWALLFFGLHGFFMRSYIIKYFSQELSSGIIIFTIFLLGLIAREIMQFMEKKNLYDIELHSGVGGNTGFFRYMPIWIMILPSITGTDNLFLLIIFIILVFCTQQIADAEERIRWKIVLKQMEKPPWYG